MSLKDALPGVSLSPNGFIFMSVPDSSSSVDGRESHVKHASPHHGFICGYRHCQPETSPWKQRITDRAGLLLCVDGEGVISYGDDDRLSAVSGDLILLKPSVAHAFQPVGTWHFLWFHFPIRSHVMHALQWPEPIPGLGKASLLHEDFMQSQTSLLEAHRLDLQRTRNWSELALILVESALVRGYNQNMAEAAGIDRRVQAAQKLLAESDGSIDQIARLCGVSRTALYEKFKKAVGVSPRQYREEALLRRAVQLLALPELSIAEISEQVGMPDPYYFSTRFRKAFGQAPRDYRKRLFAGS
ncbi:AraC family transcriptional regulator [Ruficoccus sp. ZRK36]|uniref:AraC family transcriptional regulator n=1 Tax=Ruficoccus sp. ZRK36 TaxID=2866311 RepID=UPI001C73A602|nr:AraC family transcriptional regulator [Ruficoccus sp. ZRK36]QYY37463.1 AraC family transcriptional regulator [Ruficoccus sp. ZRK36]